MAKPKTKKPLKDRPVYFVVRPMVCPQTGEMAGCLVPDGWINQRLMRERKMRTNDLVRGVLTNARNAQFHRLVHQLGTLVCKSVEGFEHLTSHEAIKRLQREAGVCCEVQQIEASPVVEAILAAAEQLMGVTATKMLRAVLPEIKTIDVTIATSIAYDTMDESDFRQLWSGICAHLAERYWPQLTTEQITQMAELMPQSEGA